MDRPRSLDPFAISIMVVLCALWGSNQGILKLTARELRGGAIIFLAPRSLEKK